MESVQEELEKRIDLGIELLNQQNFPNPWFFMINQNTLDIDNENFCILGQLYGGYLEGLQELGLWIGLEHGFSALESAMCTDIWQNKIRALRENHVQ